MTCHGRSIDQVPQWRWHLTILFTAMYPPSFFLLHVNAHARWVCPPPRNPDTGIKSGPCGLETNVFTTDDSPISSIEPGPLLVQWEESIHHTGAPFRIALSQDGSDDEPCILIDHIPHFDAVTTFPIFGNDSTYILYSLTIDIPDIQCDSCSLHLANPMTDKIGDDGAPTGIGCTDPLGTCFSVYHSCTLPISILGSTPRSEYTCPNTNPLDWPTSWMGDNGQIVDASTMGTYRRESATWDQSFLLDVGDDYRAIDMNELLTCTKTELFPAQANPPTTVVVPPPTNVPNIAAPVEVPTTPILIPVAPTFDPSGSAPVATLDDAQLLSIIRQVIATFVNVARKAFDRMRSIF